MQEIWTALAASDLAEWMRLSRWGYATVSAGHVLGIALLVGAVVPLDLRLLGVWGTVPLDRLARVLLPVAGAGLGLAILCGALLFLAGPADYAATPVFVVKMGLVAIGIVAALVFSLHPLATVSVLRRRVAALVSLACWIPALVLGRFVAFAMN